MDMEELLKLLKEQGLAFKDFSGASKAQLVALEKRLRELETKSARPGAATIGDGDGEPGESSEHAKAYDRYLRHGVTEGLAEFEKAMTVGSDPEGGYSVPSELDTELEKWERNAVPMRGVATVKTVSNEKYERLVRQGSAAAGWVDELEARPETGTPTFAALTPYFGELYANPGVSQKALDDSQFDLAEFLVEEIGEAFADYENISFTTGNGVKKPRGILDYPVGASAVLGTLREIKSGSAGAPVADKLVEVSESIKAGYRQGAAWMMSSTTSTLVRQLKAAGTGEYLWRPGLDAGRPNTLLGYPVVINEAMPSPAADSKSIVFGNFKRGYLIADVRSTRILRDPYTAKPKVLFYTTRRTGGMVKDFEALVVHTLGV